MFENKSTRLKRIVQIIPPVYLTSLVSELASLQVTGI